MVSPSIPPMSERDKRDAAVAELLSTEATYVSDMKVRCCLRSQPAEGGIA